jgi:hypothetical protein
MYEYEIIYLLFEDRSISRSRLYRCHYILFACDWSPNRMMKVLIVKTFFLSIMSTVGETIFDLSSDNHDEIWDDTELIRAYDRAHRQIQNRLRNNPKTKKDSSNKQKTKKEDVIQSSTVSFPTPIPMNMITPPKDEQDAFHSMLTAWYMAGYHAGQLAAKNWKKDS